MIRPRTRLFASALLLLLVASMAAAENRVWVLIRAKGHGGSLPGVCVGFDHAAVKASKPHPAFYVGIDSDLARRLSLSKGTKLASLIFQLQSTPEKGRSNMIAIVSVKDAVVQSVKTAGVGKAGYTVVAIIADSAKMTEVSNTTNKDWNAPEPPKEKQPGSN